MNIVRNFFMIGTWLCLATTSYTQLPDGTFMHTPSILVTGGAGYIAAPTILLLTQNNYHVVVIDRKPVAEFQLPQLINNNNVTYIQADYADTHALNTICTAYP